MSTTAGDGYRTALAEGRYVIEAELGEGGMASVFRGHDTVLDRTVAIKMMLEGLSRDPSARQRFRREAQAVARLNHQNVVAVHDSGEEPSPDGGAPVAYIVMEYVEGVTLHEMLREAVAGRGALPLDQALRITADVLAALQASHEKGLVHRDIKPANVMVTKKGVAKVMDFGIARAAEAGATHLTQTGMVVGTVHYLSPEQAEGRTVDGRSDLYAVGVMLYQMLSGRLPFDGDSAAGVLIKHVMEPPPALVLPGGPTPPAVRALIERALAKAPADRFPDAAAMLAQVDAIRGKGAAGRPLVAGAEPPRTAAGPPPAYPAPRRTPPPTPTPMPVPSRTYPQTTPYPPQYRTPYPGTGPASRVTPSPYAPYPARQQNNALSNAALAFGIVSAVLGFVIYGLFTGVVGVVLGIVATVSANRNGRSPTKALVGLVLSVLGIVLGIVMAIVFTRS